MAKFEDITGRTFNRLTVIGRDYSRKGTGRYWFCRCICGNEISTMTYSLTSGNTKSCSCLQKEWTAHKNTTHGFRHTREYVVWYGMKRRCNDPHHIGYKYYGGKGIGYTAHWETFEGFLSDMGMSPSPKHTLERLDSSLDYGPTNTIWATWKVQSRNTSRNLMVVFHGETKPLVTWIEELGLNYRLVHNRIYALKWSPERAFTDPVNS